MKNRLKRYIDHLHTKMMKIMYRFAFTKSDRRAMLLLSSLIALSIGLRSYGLVRPMREWSISSEQTEMLRALAQGNKTKTTLTKHNSSAKISSKDSLRLQNRYVPPSYMVKEKFKVDLNLADTFDLQELRGIGSAFAKRIVRYRENLGGFISIDQLHEVWGIDSSLLENIRPQLYIKNPNIKKINLNEANIKTLSRHPYLDYYQAKEIYLHRQKYGAFKNVRELMQVNLMDSGTFIRVSPYLSTP